MYGFNFAMSVTGCFIVSGISGEDSWEMSVINSEKDGDDMKLSYSSNVLILT